MFISGLRTRDVEGASASANCLNFNVALITDIDEADEIDEEWKNSSKKG